MATRTLQWNQDGKGKTSGQSDGREVIFLKLSSGNTYKVRPVGECKEFDKYVVPTADGKFKSAVCGDVETCPIRAKYDLMPGTRYGMNFWDKNDNKVKVCEFPKTVRDGIKSYFDATGEEPGGLNGADFQITVTGGNTKSKRFAVKCLGKTPLSQKTMDIIMTEKAFDLDKVFEPASVDKIEEYLGLGPSSFTTQTPQQISSAPKTSAPVAQTPQPTGNTVDSTTTETTEDIPF